MSSQPWTPQSVAHRLSHMLDALAAAGHSERFPIKVEDVALQVAAQFKWDDAVLAVQAAPIPSFDGGLFRVEDKSGWLLLYNDQIKSPGRIRFTQAHELAHYLLHRSAQDSFSCTARDMVEWGPGGKLIESEADEFASTLLMPLNHFRMHADESRIDFDMLGKCADLFGVSLTAAALKFIAFTQESAVLILARDGFMDWSVSSDKARKNGAFFKTKGNVIELPAGTLAADSTIPSERKGKKLAAATWFPHAHSGSALREMKLACDNYGYSLSLLHLSSSDKVWEPWAMESH